MAKTNRKSPWDDEKRVVDLMANYTLGLSMTEIAVKMKMTRSQIRGKIETLGLSSLRNGDKNEQTFKPIKRNRKDVIERLRLAGYSDMEINNQLGIPQ